VVFCFLLPTGISIYLTSTHCNPFFYTFLMFYHFSTDFANFSVKNKNTPLQVAVY
jgi:hypothetical protein